MVSGAVVLVAMSGLVLSGQVVFASMAVGTMLVVAVAGLGSLTVLPAVLSLLGDHVGRSRLAFVRRQDNKGGGLRRIWPRFMRLVLARPLASFLLAGTALAALAVPALGMHL